MDRFRIWFYKTSMWTWWIVELHVHYKFLVLIERILMNFYGSHTRKTKKIF